jgi:hypothetical protein
MMIQEFPGVLREMDEENWIQMDKLIFGQIIVNGRAFKNFELLWACFRLVSKIWFQCPTIIETNPKKLIFMLELCKGGDLSNDSKTAILEIHSNLLEDFNRKMIENSKTSVDFGQYINILKINIEDYLPLIISPDFSLRKALFRSL